jgi:hypothetical protein
MIYGEIRSTIITTQRAHEVDSRTMETGPGLEDDVYWREGSLKAVLAHLCTMISPLSMLHESAEERIIEKSEKPRR